MRSVRRGQTYNSLQGIPYDAAEHKTYSQDLGEKMHAAVDRGMPRMKTPGALRGRGRGSEDTA